MPRSTLDSTRSPRPASRIAALALVMIVPLAACSLAPRSDDPRAAGIGYTLGGTAYRDFEARLDPVKAAAIAALATYSMRVEALGILPNGESIRARGPRGTVLVELEREGRKRTQLRVAASGASGVDRDFETDLIIEAVRVLEPAPVR
jgi:hypothetical protein